MSKVVIIPNIGHMINAEKIVHEPSLQVVWSGENLECGVAFTLLRCIRTTLNSIGESTPKLSRVTFERILLNKKFKIIQKFKVFTR